jgi:hypothetical protein
LKLRGLAFGPVPFFMESQVTEKTKAGKGQQRPKKAENELSALKDGVIFDGKGGFLKKGDTFVPGKGADPDGLKERGLVE